MNILYSRMSILFVKDAVCSETFLKGSKLSIATGPPACIKANEGRTLGMGMARDNVLELLPSPKTNSIRSTNLP